MDVSHVRGQLGARIIGRQVLFEQIFQTHPIQDVVHQGKCPDIKGAEFERATGCLLARFGPWAPLPATLGGRRL